jgi:hypothetical protein
VGGGCISSIIIIISVAELVDVETHKDAGIPLAEMGRENEFHLS